MNTGNDLWATYIFRASAAANYNVRINYNGSGTLRVFFDGNLVGTINANSGTAVDSTAYPVSVGAGIHGVKLQCTSGNVTVNQVKVQ